MRLDELAGARVLMLGLGIDNLAALAAVSGAGPASLTAAVDDVDAVTDADCVVLVAAGAELVTTALAIDVVEAAGGGSGLRGGSGSSEGSVVVLRAPGYPRHGPVCARLERSGARFTTAVDLWMGTYGSDREVVGITGTKGKSTVTSLLDQLLDLLGIEHLMGGNIGLAIWEQAPLPPSGVPAVIEVSSYMAADAHHPPSIGVLTSLDADHLTWHGSVEAYRTDKLRLFTGGGAETPRIVLVNSADPVAVGSLETSGVEVRCIAQKRSRSLPAAERLVERGFPTHLGSNLALAVAAAEELCLALGRGTDALDAALLELADRYEALPSRHVTIAEHDGVRYIDDALASNPFAAAAAIGAVGDRPVTWLIGGQSRDVSLEPMLQALVAASKPVLLVGLPDTGLDWCERLVDGVEGSAEVSATSAADLVEAVRLAADRTPPGGVVLFAPGAPTPPRLGTYRERAAAFSAAVGMLRPG